MPTGTVNWFNANKGYGFIAPEDGSKHAFVHISAVERAGLGTLNEGQRASYELRPGRNGEFFAEDLEPTERVSAPLLPSRMGDVAKRKPFADGRIRHPPAPRSPADRPRRGHSTDARRGPVPGRALRESASVRLAGKVPLTSPPRLV